MRTCLRAVPLCYLRTGISLGNFRSEGAIGGMNRIFASILNFLNALIGVVIIIAGIGIGLGLLRNGSPGGFLLAAGGSVIVAGITCGLIAYLALIEQHLRAIAGGTEIEPSVSRTRERTDPTL